MNQRLLFVTLAAIVIFWSGSVLAAEEKAPQPGFVLEGDGPLRIAFQKTFDEPIEDAVVQKDEAGAYWVQAVNFGDRLEWYDREGNVTKTVKRKHKSEQFVLRPDGKVYVHYAMELGCGAGEMFTQEEISKYKPFLRIHDAETDKVLFTPEVWVGGASYTPYKPYLLLVSDAEAGAFAVVAEDGKSFEHEAPFSSVIELPNGGFIGLTGASYKDVVAFSDSGGFFRVDVPNVKDSVAEPALLCQGKNNRVFLLANIKGSPIVAVYEFKDKKLTLIGERPNPPATRYALSDDLILDETTESLNLTDMKRENIVASFTKATLPGIGRMADYPILGDSLLLMRVAPASKENGLPRRPEIVILSNQLRHRQTLTVTESVFPRFRSLNYGVMASTGRIFAVLVTEGN